MKQKIILSLTSLALASHAFAATKIDLHRQSMDYIKPYFALKANASSNGDELKPTRQETDFNQTTHTRFQQRYRGIPVWHATSVIHMPKSNQKRSLLANLNQKTTMNGTVFEGLDADLGVTPALALSDTQKEKAKQTVQMDFEQRMGLHGLTYQQEKVDTIIYVDDQQRAHYAFLVSFYYDDGLTGAHRPNSILDAETLQVFRTWDAVMHEQAIEAGNVLAGGVGGNEKIGETFYDGLDGHYPAMSMNKFDYEIGAGSKSFSMAFCTLTNDDITIYDMSYGKAVSSACIKDSKHPTIYWLSNDGGGKRWKDDAINGGYSPSLDAFYGATIVKHFYKDWYDVPALVEEDGVTPMQLVMRVHYGRHYDNAFWDGQQMTFGDGGAVFYPLTSLGIAAHEISHGFTQQHSNIDFGEPQMAALHEAFSDEAAVAMQYYATGTNTWDIGREVLKNEGALRYLDEPTKDGRSIDHMTNFDETEPHGGAGIFNKAFYLIATSKGWDVRRAFNIMVKANMNYWTSSMMTLDEAACGVTAAARDYHYNVADVRVAFAKVGIDTEGCDAPVVVN